MKNDGFDRRAFLKSAVAGSAVAATANIPPPAQAQPTAAQSASTGGYAFLNAEEAAFIEALVDHMVPADALTPKGTDIGLNVFYLWLLIIMMPQISFYSILCISILQHYVMIFSERICIFCSSELLKIVQ